MTAKKPKQESVSWFFPSLKDDDGVPLPPHVRFVRHLTFNVVLATALILGSLAVGMVELQTEFWRKQFGKLTAQAEEVRALSTKVTADATEALKEHMARSAKSRN